MRAFAILLVACHAYLCLAQDDVNSTMSNGNSTECKDTVDYCWTEPDSNCFGIYQPWAKGHCPSRCGFCPDPAPCEDKLDYCSQFDRSTCTDDGFAIWARVNCRKTCNLCAAPTPPFTTAGSNKGTTAGSGQGQQQTTTASVSIAPSSATGAAPTIQPLIPGGGPVNVTVPTGTMIGGALNTFIIQGPPALIPGTCFYKKETYQQDKNWYDGCDYVCNCLDAKRNRIICTERCTNWQGLTVPIDGCSWVQESGDCCVRLECQVD